MGKKVHIVLRLIQKRRAESFKKWPIEARYFSLSLIVVAMASISVALYSPTARADVTTATSAVKACVAKNLPSERNKTKPKGSNLLTACRSQVKALLKLIPGGARSDVIKLIESDIEKELADSKT